ncbi:MAG: TRAM domain-containing protein [Candidatus Izemoplasmatales bacterium]
MKVQFEGNPKLIGEIVKVRITEESYPTSKAQCVQ